MGPSLDSPFCTAKLNGFSTRGRHHPPVRAGGVRALLRRTYRVPDQAVAALMEQLTVEGDWTRSEADAEVSYDHPVLALAEQGRSISVRYGLADGFCQLLLDEPDARGTRVAPVFAAGPLEELLAVLGFEQTRRVVRLRQVFSFDRAEIQVVHVEPEGWFCELILADHHGESAAESIEVRLGLDQFDRESEQHQATANLGDARPAFVDRRRRERRLRNSPDVPLERRMDFERRRTASSGVRSVEPQALGTSLPS